MVPACGPRSYSISLSYCLEGIRPGVVRGFVCLISNALCVVGDQLVEDLMRPHSHQLMGATEVFRRGFGWEVAGVARFEDVAEILLGLVARAVRLDRAGAKVGGDQVSCFVVVHIASIGGGSMDER
ncbi:hypothetical protein ASL20_09830 [Cupriavidus necator]|nr:hypothetical protein ASL20_09830 [Cupriavidus necator]